jgi:glucose-6-phosphate 1-dehydrogenase
MNYLTIIFFMYMLGFSSNIYGTTFQPYSQTPLTEIQEHSQNAPCTVVIFGATGDLTARKLLPALHNLAREGDASPLAIVGFARDRHTDATFRDQMLQAVEHFSRHKPAESWPEFESTIFYNQSDFASDEGYANLRTLLQEIDSSAGLQSNRIYYLATHPDYFPLIVRKLHEHNLIAKEANPSGSWSRVIIEKPFGSNYASAESLQNEIAHYLDDRDLYRMDHYLGKEGVQNIATLRFANVLFEPLWNNKHIDNVQITLAEEIGIGTRAQFWEETGSLRDVLQNHLMQLLALVAMEPPSDSTARAIHEAKIKLLNDIRPIPLDNIDSFVVRGQYGSGEINGENVAGYQEEKGVPKDSSVETFVAAKLFIDNPRWQGVPFYLRTGKRLPKQATEVAITFKPSARYPDREANVFFIRIQPDTGIFVKARSKVPQLDTQIESVLFGYRPESYFNKKSPEAYEKLLYDCMRGENSLYVQLDEQLAAWKLLTPVLNFWQTDTQKTLPHYRAGSWGPLEAEQMLQNEGHQWQQL